MASQAMLCGAPSRQSLHLPSVYTRGIRPPDPGEITPNPNDPASVPPATVGPNVYRPGDAHGVTIEPTTTSAASPPRIIPSAWSGWPAEWWTPFWGAGGYRTHLGETAWMCLDRNSMVLSTMPPYLVNPAPSLTTEWLRNPDPELYTSWEEFAKQLFRDYMIAEAFVLVTARYSTGWPARFHVVPPWAVNVEMDDGRRVYSVGQVDVTSDMIHIRYQSSIDDAHGHGALEAGHYSVTIADVLGRYTSTLISQGGIPFSVLKHPEQLDPGQAAQLKADWVSARMSAIGEPAVLSGGIEWAPTQLNPEEMALLPLLNHYEGRIAELLGVPSEMIGVESGRGSNTYANVTNIYDAHWRQHLRPRAAHVMAALSESLLPRGTTVQLNHDAYVQPKPLERAQTYQILNGIVDADGNPALSVAEIRRLERFDNTFVPDDLSSGVFK